MEKYKNSDLTTPDSRSPGLGVTIEGLRDKLDTLELHGGVPEDVRSAFNSARTLFLYGYFYYPFFSLSLPVVAGVVEMALRARYPFQPTQPGQSDWRGLRVLLKKAADDGLLSEAGFPHLEASRTWWREVADAMEVATGERCFDDPPPYVEKLIDSLPKVRNSFIHTSGHPIGTPPMMLTSMVVSAEIINQLWPRPAE